MKFGLALLALAFIIGLSFPACSPASRCSYDQGPCAADGDCALGLTCDNAGPSASHRCTQVSTGAAARCDNAPLSYKFVPPPVSPTGVNGPEQKITDLEQGKSLGAGICTGTLPSCPNYMDQTSCQSNGCTWQYSGFYKAGWFSDWKAAGAIGIVIAISLIALAGMIGHGFNLPEVKAFVDAELMQAIISALLLVGIMGIITFTDELARATVSATGLPVTCNSSEPCYMTVSKTYVQNIYDTASGYAKERLREQVQKQSAASFGFSTQLNFWFMLFAGTNMRPNAGESLDAERAGTIFETTTKLMASLSAQKYFLEAVSFGIAPIFLLLGILLRTFFFTRKLGGLLLAIALALFIIFPLTYAFAWFTMNVTIYGERAFGPSVDPNCPSECTARYPVAFFVEDKDAGNPPTSMKGRIRQFDTSQDMMIAGITDANWKSGDVNNDGNPEYPGLVACRDLSGIGITSSITDQLSGAATLNGKKITVTSPASLVPDLWVGYTVFTSNNKNSKITANGDTEIFVENDMGTGPVSYTIKGNGCSGCPDYCREVPFPSGLPGCSILRCASCNAGCKIMRQRMDCSSKCQSGMCPASCRTVTPVEDKCYLDDTGANPTPVAADLSVSCGGCDGCPTWCRMLIDDPATGAKKLRYPDLACQIAACKTPPTGTCPEKCMYYSPMGTTSDCNVACSSCPRYCRISNLNNYISYDATYPKTIPGCSTPECTACNINCKLDISAPPSILPKLAAGCAPYPTITPDHTECKDCPTYCRFADYAYITDRKSAPTSPPYSAVPMDGAVPAVCRAGLSGRLDCSAASCGAGCQGAAPPLCRVYDASSTDYGYCTRCADNGRVLLHHENIVGPPDLLRPAFALTTSSGSSSGGTFCSVANCAGACLKEVGVPGEKDYGTCSKKNAGIAYDCSQHNGIYAECAAHSADCNWEATCKNPGAGAGNCLQCALGCRVKNSPYPPSNTCSIVGCQSVNCPDICKADLALEKGNTCSEFVGNAKKCVGEYKCKSHLDQGSCEVDSPCRWETDLSEPIDSRIAPYNIRDNCAQCPENCRIILKEGTSEVAYTGSCGVWDPDHSRIACSEVSCPLSCRTTVEIKPTGTPVCKRENPFGLPCDNCPLFCRRENDIPSVTPNPCNSAACNSLDPGTGVGCSDACKIPDAPNTICSQCFDCPLDCTYYPAVRTDCSELCSDEALAGPISIGPDDYIKKLPGAEGESDVRSVGMLMLPALVLPLFCIVITVAFVRVFSPVLGGDIEIPGLSKII